MQSLDRLSHFTVAIVIVRVETGTVSGQQEYLDDKSLKFYVPLIAH